MAAQVLLCFAVSLISSRLDQLELDENLPEFQIDRGVCPHASSCTKCTGEKEPSRH